MFPEISGNIRKFPEIAEDHNFGTEHATNINQSLKVVFCNSLSCYASNSFFSKSGVSAFWK